MAKTGVGWNVCPDCQGRKTHGAERCRPCAMKAGVFSFPREKQASRWAPAPERFWTRVNKTDSCWLWLGFPNPGGYGVFRDNKRTFLAHRFAWLLVHGSLPSNLDVCHSCDNPACVRPDHLFIGTHSDNMRDRDSKGRGVVCLTQVGERHHLSKITAVQAIEAFKRVSSGERNRDVAKSLGIGASVVSRIKHGKAWRRTIEAAAR